MPYLPAPAGLNMRELEAPRSCLVGLAVRGLLRSIDGFPAVSAPAQARTSTDARACNITPKVTEL
jgi:hypothetical protein